MVKSRMV